MRRVLEYWEHGQQLADRCARGGALCTARRSPAIPHRSMAFFGQELPIIPSSGGSTAGKKQRRTKLQGPQNTQSTGATLRVQRAAGDHVWATLRRSRCLCTGRVRPTADHSGWAGCKLCASGGSPSIQSERRPTRIPPHQLGAAIAIYPLTATQLQTKEHIQTTQLYYPLTQLSLCVHLQSGKDLDHRLALPCAASGAQPAQRATGVKRIDSVGEHIDVVSVELA